MTTPAPSASYRLLLAGHGAQVAAILALTLVFASDTLLAVTILPAAVLDVGGLSRYALAVGAVTVAQSIAAPLAGMLVDRKGFIPAVVTGVALFALGNVIAATAASMTQIAAGRFVQGAGGGILIPVATAAVLAYLPTELRSRAVVLKETTWVVASLLGPALGAVAVQVFSWRVAFLLELPLAAVALTIAVVALRGRTPPAVERPSPYDLVGPLLCGSIILALLTVPPLAVVPAVLFILGERSPRTRVIPPQRTIRLVVCLYLAQGFMFASLEEFIGLDLQRGLGLEPIVTALTLAAAALSWLAGSAQVARLARPPRSTLPVTIAIAVVGGVIATLPDRTGVAAIVGYVIAAAGLGPSLQAFIALLGEEATDQEGRASAAAALATTLGLGAGLALAGTFVLEGDIHDGARLAYGASTAVLAVIGTVAVTLLRR